MASDPAWGSWRSTEIAVALRQRGNCLRGLGDLTGAMNDYKESLAIFDATGGPTVTGRLSTLLAIARLQCLERDRRGASATTARAKSALDPTNPKVMWVGTGESWTRNSVSVGNGVYKSTDGGETWTRMGLDGTERITG